MLLILFIIITLIVMAIAYKMNKYDTPWAAVTAFGLLSAVINGLILLIISQCVDDVEVGRTSKKINIYSLRTDSSINGSFQLGSGYVNSSQVYYCYTDDNGGLRLENFPAKNTVLFEAEDKPFAHWDQVHKKIPSWVIPFSWQKETKVDSQYYLIVPKGTVIKDFKTQ